MEAVARPAPRVRAGVRAALPLPAPSSSVFRSESSPRRQGWARAVRRGVGARHGRDRARRHPGGGALERPLRRDEHQRRLDLPRPEAPPSRRGSADRGRVVGPVRQERPVRVADPRRGGAPALRSLGLERGGWGAGRRRPRRPERARARCRLRGALPRSREAVHAWSQGSPGCGTGCADDHRPDPGRTCGLPIVAAAAACLLGLRR